MLFKNKSLKVVFQKYQKNVKKYDFIYNLM